ncbi:sulfotransferase [Iodidimonas gelatinilytica]|nr:sulfotransferase [Iodidimonas gelatinilytica]
MSKQPPVIFIGMHRSGTSMLGRVMERLGLFVGAHKEGNNEAVFFLKMNTWLLGQCGGRWDYPQPIHDLWDNEVLLGWVERYVRDQMNGPRALHFLGLKRYLKYRQISAVEEPWGWKDPRNSFTLPLWLRLFPDARIIHIRRHGVDVAQSLAVRGGKGMEASTQFYQKYRALAALRPKRGGFMESPRCAKIEGGFSLWAEYLQAVETQLAGLPDHQKLEIVYEDFLADPIHMIPQVAQFCGLQCDMTAYEASVADIRPSRALPHKADERLALFAKENAHVLAQFGY